MPKIIHVYNENCVLAGKPVRGQPLAEYENLDDFGDCHPEEVSQENLEWHSRRNSRYHDKIANSIRDAMC